MEWVVQLRENKVTSLRSGFLIVLEITERVCVFNPQVLCYVKFLPLYQSYGRLTGSLVHVLEWVRVFDSHTSTILKVDYVWNSLRIWKLKYIKQSHRRPRGNMLASRSKFRRAKPDWGRWIFSWRKNLFTSPPGGTLGWGSQVWDFWLAKEPQAWKNRPVSKI